MKKSDPQVSEERRRRNKRTLPREVVLLGFDPNAPIKVPKGFQEKRLSDFWMSTRLKNSLLNQGIDLFGKLQPYCLQEIALFPECGPTSILELARLLLDMRSKKGRLLRFKDLPKIDLNTVIEVPEAARTRLTSEFEMTERLRDLFKQKRITTFGKLHGKRYGDLAKVRSVGERTLQELAQLLTLLERGCAEVQETEELVEIPKKYHDEPISKYKLPQRMLRVLTGLGFEKFGDLQGTTYQSLAQAPYCAVKSLQELKRIFEEDRFIATRIRLRKNKKRLPIPLEIVVPAAVRNLPLSELPASSRLRTMLARLGVEKLGELHGISDETLVKIKGCGCSTLEEFVLLIKRASAGEFKEKISSKTPLFELLKGLEEGIDSLKEAQRSLVLEYLNGKNGREIAQQRGLTHQNIYDQLKRSLPSIRLHRGTLVAKILPKVKARLMAKNDTLRTEQLEAWVLKEIGSISQHKPLEWPLKLSPEASLRLLFWLIKESS